LKTIDRWLLKCHLCRQRFMQNGDFPPTDHACPEIGPNAKRRLSEIKRIIWRKPSAKEDHCRMAEPRSIVVEHTPRAGECSRHCRGSLSPTCYCPVCFGEQHGAENVATPARGNGLEIMDHIIACTPDREVPRRGRKST
jgi:hypothetical protein